MRLKSITNRTFVAPVLYANAEKAVLFAQMEIRAGSAHTFEESRDRKAFEILGQVVSGIIERIFVNVRTEEN